MRVFIHSLSEPVVNEEVFTYRPLTCYRWITSYTTGSRAYSNTAGWAGCSITTGPAWMHGERNWLTLLLLCMTSWSRWKRDGGESAWHGRWTCKAMSITWLVNKCSFASSSLGPTIWHTLGTHIFSVFCFSTALLSRSFVRYYICRIRILHPLSISRSKDYKSNCWIA